MNAKESAELLERMKSCDILHGNEELVLRALRLLAAAEANDGETPQTDDFAEQDFVLETIRLHPKILARIKAWADHARRLERERNGLAARVGELERVESYAVHLTCEVVRAISDDNLCGREIDEILSNALAEQPAGFTAARSKP